MPSDVENTRVLIEVLKTIVDPVNQSLARHSEAVQMAIGLIQRLVEMSQQEPTRNTIVNEFRKEINDLAKEYQSALDEHDKLCEKRGGLHNNDYCKTAEGIVKQAIEKMESSIKKSQSEMEEKIKPVQELKESFDDLKKFVKIAWIVTSSIIGAFGILYTTIKWIKG